MRKTLAILIILLACNNNSREENKFKNNKLFTQTETAQLLMLLALFDQNASEIMGVKSNDIIEIYNAYLPWLAKQQNKAEINIGMNEAQQTQLESIIDSILINELWSESYTLRINRSGGQDTLDKIFILNTKGRLFQFMEEELSLEYPLIKKHIDIVHNNGSLTPSFFADLLLDYQHFAINDDRIRLIFAIHYIGVNKGFLEKNKMHNREFKINH